MAPKTDIIHDTIQKYTEALAEKEDMIAQLLQEGKYSFPLSLWFSDNYIYRRKAIKRAAKE